MRRRDFMIVLDGAVGYPQLARAQQKAMPVIGFLHSLSLSTSATVVAAFRQGLSDAGYIEGQNVAIEYRWAEGNYDVLPTLAADLVGRKVEVILTGGGTAPVLAAKNATSTTPIVFSVGSDPVEAGLVASLARPGGNATGISALGFELLPKRFELLIELVPQIRVIALLVNPNVSTWEGQISGAQEAASTKRVQLHILKAGTEREIDDAFVSLAQLHADAIVVGSDAFFYNRRDQLVARTARHAVPAIYELPGYVAAGGLISYGTSLAGVYRQAADYVSRVLKGTKPADLPVMQPTKFDLVINLRTAKALGLTVSQSLLARADEVIE